MLEKQDRQFFYTRKILILCVFLFFSLGSQAGEQGRTEEDSQIAEPTREGETNDLEEGQELNERRLEAPVTLFILSQNCREEVTDEQINQLFGIFGLNREQQFFWINENGTAEITSPFLQQRWIVEGENGQQINKIENEIKNKEPCRICLKIFEEMKNETIFVFDCNQMKKPHMFCHVCSVTWFQWNNNNIQKPCPCCGKKHVPVIPENGSKEDKIRKLKKIRNINYLERNQQEQSHWKLYIRNKDYDNNIWDETQTNPDNWFIVDGVLSDMEVLEINVNNPKDLEEYHIKILKELSFHKVKFNNDQEPREIYLILENEARLKILHNGGVVFNEPKWPDLDNQMKEISKTMDFKGDILGRVVCRYMYIGESPVYGLHGNIFVFNEENLEFLKETKGLVIFSENLNNVSIGLEGNEIIPKEDIEEVFIASNKVGLMCDNVNNLKTIETTKKFLFSPIDLSKINQINEMRKDTNKITIKNTRFDLIGDDCFLLPLFKLNNIGTYWISLRITRETAQREIVPQKSFLEELKEMFAGVEIKGEKTDLSFLGYAILVLLYFDENALNVLEISFVILDIEYNDIWDELTKEGCSVLTNQIVKKQNAGNFCLHGECFDFAVNVKIMENINFTKLTMFSQTFYTNENFVCKKDRSIIRNGLKELRLVSKAIKYLLYFKEINKLEKLDVVPSVVSGQRDPQVFGILDQVKDNNIQFFLPTEADLYVPDIYPNETLKKLKMDVVSFTRGTTLLN